MDGGSLLLDPRPRHRQLDTGIARPGIEAVKACVGAVHLSGEQGYSPEPQVEYRRIMDNTIDRLSQAYRDAGFTPIADPKPVQVLPFYIRAVEALADIGFFVVFMVCGSVETFPEVEQRGQGCVKHTTPTNRKALT